MDQQLIYLDREGLGHSVLILPIEIEVIYAGKTIEPSYPGCEVTALDRILSEQYDFYLCFHKDLPQFSFYPVPELFIFAIDSYGGSFVSTSLDAKSQDAEGADIYYLDCKLQLHWLAPNMHTFLSLMVFEENWKNSLGVGEYPVPNPSEKAKTFLINTFELMPPTHIERAPDTEIRIFPSLAAAKESLPFVELDKPQWIRE